MDGNRVYCATLDQFATMCALFQREGLAFTAQTLGDSTYFIDSTGH